MCGIAAAFAPGAASRLDAVEAGLHAQRHRGPHGAGLWSDPATGVALGHRRLSIVDLDGGRQPIASEDGRCVVVVNGALHGYRELRRDLQARGHRFATGSDSEVALHLYEDLGLDFVQHLRGEFALVLWDAERQRLVAVRDRFGIKPLCYHRAADGALLLASSARGLLAMGVPRAFDEAALGLGLALQYTPPDRTVFAGIHQLEPGTLLVATAEEQWLQRYWDLDLGDTEDLVHDAPARLLAHLDAAVALRLQTDVPVCCHLSGGIDSSTVAALAQRDLATPLDCFTVCFEGAGAYDETDNARLVAAHLGAHLHEVRVTEDDLVDVLPAAVAHGEGLAVNLHLPAKFLLNRRIAAHGYRVALTGEGADEVLAGYAHLRQDLLDARGESSAALLDSNRASAGIMLGEDGAHDTLRGVQERLGFVPRFLRAKAALGARLGALLAPPFRRQWLTEDAGLRFLAAFGDPSQLEGRHPLRQSTYLWTKSALAVYMLRTLGDGMEMAHGVEGRLPFLDHHLYEFARTLHLDQLIRGGEEKHVLRTATAGLLPEAIRVRQKHPFVAPPLRLDPQGPVMHLVQDHLRSRAFGSLPYFDHDAVQRLLDGWHDRGQEERVRLDPVVMTLLSAAGLAQLMG